MDPVSADFLKLVRGLTSAEVYDKAYEALVVTLSRDPSLVRQLRSEFHELLDKYNNHLASHGKIQDIFKKFEIAFKIYPDCYVLYTDLGKYLFKYGFYKEAWAHFAKALYFNPLHIKAEKYLNSVKNLLVERWHFRMLNDNIRNSTYKLAIQQKLDPLHDKVLDVGTGTGLFAIYANEYGAKDIVGCDGSETMTELASNIIEKHGLTNNIKILNKMSTSMVTQDLSGKATLLITELFDAGLFGENVLLMLEHAWYNLLAEGAQVIPYRAEFFVIGAQCNNLNLKYKLRPEVKKLFKLGNKNVHVMKNETYDCEDVHLQKDIKYLTKHQIVMGVNFNDVKSVESHLMKQKPYAVTLEAIEKGEVNMIVGWFNLYLSENLMLTTDPRSDQRANAWQQALFYDNLPRPVKAEELFELIFFINDGRLMLSNQKKITRVSPEVIRFLNDLHFMNVIGYSIPTACIYLNQIEEMSQIMIADLCPFPLFGLYMLTRGAASLLCYAKTKNDQKFITEVFKNYNIPLTKVSFLEDIDNIKEDKFHAIFVNILELGGDIDIRLKNISQVLMEKHLHPDGLFMPANIFIVGQLVSSHWLLVNNNLLDVNIKCKMASQVNNFAVTTNYFIDFNTLKYVPITDPIVICRYPSLNLAGSSTVIKNDGIPNAILCSYWIELMPGLITVSTDRPGSFIDGMVFILNQKECLTTGTSVKLFQKIDEEGSFKLALRI